MRKLRHLFSGKVPCVDSKEQCVYYQPSVVASLLTEERETSEGDTYEVRHRDLYLLFDQKRLSSIGADAARSFIDSLNASQNSQLAEIRSKMTDEQLIKFVKSRNIQSLSELQNWYDYISANMDDLATTAKEVAASATSEPVASETIEPTKS